VSCWSMRGYRRPIRAQTVRPTPWRRRAAGESNTYRKVVDFDSRIMRLARLAVDVKETVQRLLAEYGLADPATPEQLNLLDQYHIGGLAAVDYAAAAMALSPDNRVLDIGSGFGGPALVAQMTGLMAQGLTNIQAQNVILDGIKAYCPEKAGGLPLP
jgi:hypothetical protein